jgi:hypothetical protein
VGGSIDGQMGQTHWAARGTALKSSDLTRPSTMALVPGPAQPDG